MVLVQKEELQTLLLRLLRTNHKMMSTAAPKIMQDPGEGPSSGSHGPTKAQVSQKTCKISASKKSSEIRARKKSSESSARKKSKNFITKKKIEDIQRKEKIPHGSRGPHAQIEPEDYVVSQNHFKSAQGSSDKNDQKGHLTKMNL